MQGSTELSSLLLSRKAVGAWGVYGNETVETGLSMLRVGGEGIVEMVDANGRKAAGIRQGTVPGGKYYYFTLPDWVKNWPEYELAIEYFDSAPGQLVPAYDSKEFSCTACPPLKLTGAKTWKVYRCLIKDAKFAKGCNGFDFRLGGNVP